MSMTAYNILECRKHKDFICKEKKEIETPPPPPRARARARVLPFIIDTYIITMYIMTHARRAKGNPVPIPEPGSGTAYNSGPRKSVRRGNPK